MAVKLSPFVLIFVCVALGLQNASGTIQEMILKTGDGEKTCTTKYTTCTLTIDSKPVMERGEKGDIGDYGPKGSSGEKGEQGERGFDGPKGSLGEKGEKGERGFDGVTGFGDMGPPGIKGDKGFPGYKGDQGERGYPGHFGPPGYKGEPGVKGDRGHVGPAGSLGLPGPVGPPGAPGRHGVCPCHDTPNAAPSKEHDEDDFGTEDWPAEVPCKSAGAKIVSGTYYLGPTGKPMKVFCNMTSLETCIRISKKTPEYNHNSSKGAFWLKEMGVDMKELYNNLSVEQLTWLRDRSESVRQTLKYNCLDSVPYSKYNMSSSVKLWSWNDVIIGPYPTDQSPIFYSVPEATDECKEGSTEWSSTIIELQSSNVNRLPIVNMWIGDIRNAEQKMSIESVELCFG